MDRTNTESVHFKGSTTAVKIFNANPNRSYINFYAVSGNCYINIGDNDFDSNAKLLPEGVMWEPRVALTNSIWYKGVGTILSMIAAGDTALSTKFPIAFEDFIITYESHALTY